MRDEHGNLSVVKLFNINFNNSFETLRKLMDVSVTLCKQLLLEDSTVLLWTVNNCGMQLTVPTQKADS